jgi:glycosyltransferase involved in cell wall biosynthesis
MTLVTCIPVYNGERTIDRALTSLFVSSRQPDRIVVFDDGSDDRTRDIVRLFIHKTGGWPTIDLVPCKNVGYVRNSNRCLELAAETEYLHILHADDEVGTQFYAKAIASMLRGRGLAFSQPLLFDDETMACKYVPGRQRKVPLQKFIQERADLGHIYYCGTLLRTNRKPIEHRFKDHFPQLCDQVLWSEFARDCDNLVELDPYLTTYHIHGNSWTANQKKNIESFVDEEWRAMEEIAGRVNLRKKCLFACRSMVKCKEALHTYYGFQQSDEIAMGYARQIKRAAINRVGWLFWYLGVCVVSPKRCDETMKKRSEILWLDLGDLGVFLHPSYAHDKWQDHGLGLLRTILHRSGIQTDLASTRMVLLWNQLIPAFKRHKMLLMNVRSYTFPFAYKAATLYKKVNPNGLVIVGGMHCTVAPDEMKEAGCFDKICQGIR